MAVIAASSAIDAYVHQLPRNFLTRRSAREQQPQQQQQVAFNGSVGRNARELSSALSMAFPLKEGEISNMFEGPAPLVKERDACGVGFIANTNAGGE